ncbi:MAG: hypothetical protein K2X47_03745 [Bdellovibrionales bacterium]|nr:hypothetical protein [Bdellovibrionales bacterium]
MIWSRVTISFLVLGGSLSASAKEGIHKEFKCEAIVSKRSFDPQTEFVDFEDVERASVADVHQVDVDSNNPDKDQEPMTLELPKLKLQARVSIRTFSIPSLFRGVADERLLSIYWTIDSKDGGLEVQSPFSFSGGSTLIWNTKYPLTVNELITVVSEKIGENSNYVYQLICNPLR